MSGSEPEFIATALARLGLPDVPECRALVQLLDQTVSRLDRKGRILGVWLGEREYVSDVATATLDAFELHPGHFVTDLVDTATRGHLLTAIEASLDTGDRIDIEFSTRATNRLLHLAGSCVPCGPDEVIWITRDLTSQYEAHRSAEARAELEATVSDCLQSLIDVDGDELDLAMESVMHRIAAFFDAQSVYLRRFRDAHHVEVVSQWRAPHVRRPSPGRSLAGGGVFPWAARQLAQHPVLLIRDVAELPPEAAQDFVNRMTNTGGRGLVWIRTGPPRRPTGIFGLVFDAEPVSDDPDSYEPLIGLAHTMLALANRGLDAERREIQHRVFELIARGAPLEEALAQVCRLRESGWPGQHCVAWLVGTDGNLHPVGAPEGQVGLDDFDPCPQESLEASVLGSGAHLWIEPDAGQRCSLGSLAETLSANSLELTPLLSSSRGAVSGVLAVYDTSSDPIDPEGVEEGFPALAASLASVAIERHGDLSELAHQATHDALTGLANRSTFLERLSEALERTSSSGRLTAVLYCDVDRFKEMNDRLGHATGDSLLRLLGERIRAQVPSGDTVARLGGDEFAILLEDLADEEQAFIVADEILETVRAMAVPGNRLVSISIGVAVSASGTDHADGMLRDADVAMYQAKSGGRDRVEVFRERIRRQAQDRDRLSRDLAVAITEGQIDVHFQPMVALATGELTGFEALARWDHPERGPVSPGVFVPIAESSGLISQLGDLVLDRALKCASTWNGLDLHVNLSPHQVDTRGSVDRLLASVRRSGVPATRIAMEITETVLLSESVSTTGNLGAILDAGIGLVLDDFGTGYASLTYLRRIPFRGIKVDQSFVAGVDANADDATIVSMVLALAASLELDVVAEGVETAAQERALREMGCSRVQGFRYSPAVPGSEVPDLIRRFASGKILAS